MIPFLIGCYAGYGSFSSSDDFLADFVADVRTLKANSVLFLVANCSLIPKMYIFFCLEVKFKCYRLKLIKIWWNLKISHMVTLFDLQWWKLTLKQQNVYIFGISEQFATRKSTISKYRATSNFGLLMRIFNLQGLRANERPKKK
jgi:hypothetical protein